MTEFEVTLVGLLLVVGLLVANRARWRRRDNERRMRKALRHSALMQSNKDQYTV